MTAHTADLNQAEFREVREFLKVAFRGDFADADWDHALGGYHVMLHEDGEIIGHSSVVQRRLVIGGRTFRTGYVEALAVREDRRRRGHGGTIMQSLEQIIRRAHEIGALSATDDGAALYRARGWTLWSGPSAVMSPRGVERTPGDDGAIYVLPLARDLDPTTEIICDWRDGDAW